MATTHLRSPIDTADAPKVAPPIKMIASVAAILFAIIAFVIPTDVARVILAVVATAFGVIGALPPPNAVVKTRLFGWIAAALAIASLLTATFRAFGADKPNQTEIQQIAR